MDYITVAASRPGAAPPKIEKRTRDSRLFEVDCTSILVDNELIVGAVTCAAPVALTVSDIRSRRGKSIIFRVSGGPVTTVSIDFSVLFTIHTSTSNVLEVPVIIKAFST